MPPASFATPFYPLFLLLLFHIIFSVPRKMDAVPDSDGENSLPVLSVAAIDTELLRRLFDFLSSDTKHRLIEEAQGTLFEEMYKHIEREMPQSSPEKILIQSSSPQKEYLLMEISQIPEATPASQAQLETSQLETPRTFGRSLRRRTFASRHPYVADQADYLGICTIDGLNEMFSEDDDLVSVAKVLNQLYLKRKKRYPDEERYKARNFYAHLGKSKAMALQGDPDAESMELQDEILSSQANYEPENNSDDEDQELIPFEDIEQHKVPPRVHDLASDSEDESDNLIDVHSPLREKHVSKVRKYKLSKKVRRLERPRKGLAIRKAGSGLTGTNPLEHELDHFIQPDDEPEEYTPNHKAFFQPQITSYHLDLSEMVQYVSSSDYNSDSESDIFSEMEAANTSISSDIQEPQHNHLDHYFEGAALEADHINPLFASGVKSKHPKKKPQSRLSIQPPKRRKTALPEDKHHSIQHKLETSNYSSRSVKSRNRQSGTRRASYGSLNSRRRMQPLTQNNGAKNRQALRPKSKAVGRLNQKQSVLSINVDSDSDKENRNVVKGVLSRPYRENKFLATTAFEVESLTKFVSEHKSYIAGIQPAHFNPSRSSLFSDNHFNSSESILAILELRRVHTIGDGFIFFPHVDTVSFSLAGRSYVFGLFQEESSKSELVNVLFHLQKLMFLVKALLNDFVRNEMKVAVRGITKWLLIHRQSISHSIWDILEQILDNFTKLQTKEIRKKQTFFYASLLFIFYVACQFEKLVVTGCDKEAFEKFHRFCTDFWSTLFRTYDPMDLSAAYSGEHPSELLESLCMMNFIFSDKRETWWPSVNEALQELNPLLDSSFESFNMMYTLASMCPPAKYNWSPFVTILNTFQSTKDAEAHHDFIDVCQLVHNNLNWPLEERLVLSLYSSFAKRKFTNFESETSIPTSIGLVQSRHDLPQDTVFERFLGFVYEYISGLSDRKEVKRLITKLVASSQYHYQKGRKYQIMFVNRLNLMLLLFQISDVELKGLFCSLIDQIIEFKDMFLFSRAVDAFHAFVEISERKQQEIPTVAFDSLLKCFCTSYDRIQGMPSLLKKLIDDGLNLIDNSKIMQTLRFLNVFDLSSIPDKLRSGILNRILSFAEVLRTQGSPGENVSELVEMLIRSIISFLSSQMNRLPVNVLQHDALIESTIEKSIQIWIHLAHANDTQNWNFMMLQKYQYLGNEYLRERFALYFCWVYLNQGITSRSVILEMDKLLCKAIIATSLSKYIPLLFTSLSNTAGSLITFRNQSEPHQLLIQGQRFQILSNVLHQLSRSSSMVKSEKVLLVADMVKQLEAEYNLHYDKPQVIEFLRRIISVMSSTSIQLLENNSDFWAVSEKLGFPSKRLQTTWALSTNKERILMLNVEFVNAIRFEKSYAEALGKWISSDNTSLLYALLEIYLMAAKNHELYWAHVCYLVKYIYFRLQCCMVNVVDRLFDRLLKLMLNVVRLASPMEDTPYVLYQVEAISICTGIMHFGIYTYDGYEELDQHLRHADLFLAYFSGEKGKVNHGLFTDTTLGELKTSEGPAYLPPHEHTPEEHKKAIQSLQVCISRLQDKRHQTWMNQQPAEDFDSDFFDYTKEVLDIKF